MTYRNFKAEIVKKWDQDNPICINCGAKVTEGWGHECLIYDCEECGTFFTNEDVWEINKELQSSTPKVNKNS